LRGRALLLHVLPVLADQPRPISMTSGFISSLLSSWRRCGGGSPRPSSWCASFPLALAAGWSRAQAGSGRWSGAVVLGHKPWARSLTGSLASKPHLVYWVGSQHARRRLDLWSSFPGCSCLAPVEFSSTPDPKALSTGRANHARDTRPPWGVRSFLVRTVSHHPGIRVCRSAGMPPR